MNNIFYLIFKYLRKKDRVEKTGDCVCEFFPSSTWLLLGAFQPWQAPGIWSSAERTFHMGCDPVYMCSWRDSCPAHLPLLQSASFIINLNDQVAMSLCPCQGMLCSDLSTSTRHSLARAEAVECWHLKIYKIKKKVLVFNWRIIVMVLSEIELLAFANFFKSFLWFLDIGTS